MSASGDGQEFVDMAEDAGVTESFIRVITAPLFAVAAGLSGLIAAGFDAVGGVVESLEAVRRFIVAVVAEGPIQIIGAGADATSAELSEFGVAAFAVGVASIAVAWLIFSALDPDIPLLDSLLPWR